MMGATAVRKNHFWSAGTYHGALRVLVARSAAWYACW